MIQITLEVEKECWACEKPLTVKHTVKRSGVYEPDYIFILQCPTCDRRWEVDVGSISMREEDWDDNSYTAPISSLQHIKDTVPTIIGGKTR